jgi:hypothetical protein
MGRLGFGRPQRHDATNGDAIAQAQPLQLRTKRGGGAVVGVGDHAVDLEAGLHGQADLGEGDAPFLARRDRVGNAGGPTIRIGQPLGRQIQIDRQGPRPAGVDQDTRDRHLTVADLAQRAAVLALDTDRVPAWLRQSRVVDRQHAAADRDLRTQLRPYAAGLPRRIGHEVLERLIAARITQVPVHGLHRLSLAVVEQAFDVLTGRRPLRAAAEAAAERIQERAQAREEHAGRGVIHATQRRDFARSVQAPTRDQAVREGDKVVLAASHRSAIWGRTCVSSFLC